MSEGSGDEQPPEVWKRAWRTSDPRRLVGHGHPVGDFLEAYDWEVLDVRAHLPRQVRNPFGALFGGFTPTYVDFVALHTWWAGREPTPGRPRLVTLNMRVDYYAPILCDHFEMDSRVVNRRGSTCWVETRFFGPAPGGEVEPDTGPEARGELLAFAYTTLKAV
jgi:acyl-coenzyme A thioesterase PaaI-like protein